MDLVPIRVKIGLRANGHADHPDWFKLPLATTMDPASQMMHGWKYDKQCGHTEHETNSPSGMQWGVVLVSELFATEAVATFPSLVTRMTAAQLETFWDERACAHMPVIRTDTVALQGLKAERDLMVDTDKVTAGIDVRIGKALDPDDPTPGKKIDKTARWATAKDHLGITLASSVPLT